MFGWFRWQLAKMNLSAVRVRPQAYVHVQRVFHKARVEDFPPSLESYGRLADLWDDYASRFAPPYGRFLAAAGRRYRLAIRSVLDVACGTGLLTRQVAQWAESVVGLDASEAMLRRAADRTTESNVRYVRGDFRSFRLDETFDAVLCGGDSLNYLEAPGQLADVFRCVRGHLRPGGVVIFDAIDAQFCRELSPTKTMATVDGEAFEVYYFYDPKMRVSESRAVFGKAVERHRRIPIEVDDVRQAAREADLAVTECFSRNDFSLFDMPLSRQFYVLRAPL